MQEKPFSWLKFYYIQQYHKTRKFSGNQGSTANRATSFLNIAVMSTNTYGNWLPFKLNRATPVSQTTSAPVRLISASAADKILTVFPTSIQSRIKKEPYPESNLARGMGKNIASRRQKWWDQSTQAFPKLAIIYLSQHLKLSSMAYVRQKSS